MYRNQVSDGGSCRVGNFLVRRGFSVFLRVPLVLVALLLIFSSAVTHAEEPAEVLHNTTLLNLGGDLSFAVLDRIDQYLLTRTEVSIQERERFWQRDFASSSAYRKSIHPNRQRLARYVGLVDERIPFDDIQLVASLKNPALVAESEDVRVYAVRWPVFAGVWGEGLLIEPAESSRAQVVLVPDADWSPEAISGLIQDPAVPAAALRLAESGCRVIVPTLIDRDNTWSGNPRVRMTNQTHREFIYRQAFYLGRHLIGYEVQKILAVVDYFESRNSPENSLPIGVAGYGEGGLLAFYSAALDERIQAALVSGYFQEREAIWQEPVYRNVWGLLQEFGDAGIASLILPRSLVIEACRGPEVAGPPPPRNGRMDAASGRLGTPALESVRREYDRVKALYTRLNLGERLNLVASEDGKGTPLTDRALIAFLAQLEQNLKIVPARSGWRYRLDCFDSADRMKRQVLQLVDFNQDLMHDAAFSREAFWSRADRSSVRAWQQSTEWYREYFWKEIIGWLPPPQENPNPQTRRIYETEKWTGYEVLLDTWPKVFSYGILLVPKDIKKGERRPVVVAQHGRGGRPQDVCNPEEDTRAYHSFGARLADRGFVVYAPQNLYIGEERYRELQRKSNPLKLTIFAPMVRQHEQVLKWLGDLPFVDSRRIGFYGLSYGGKSAMFIPAILKDYALSICSGDFNEEVWKHVSIEAGYSFMLTKEHEHTEFGFGDRFNYAELAGLIAPRPFMVERGHNDGVGEDHWVAFEYAKARRLYVQLGIQNLIEIEYFEGPHEIHGRGTFDFLDHHLDWLPE